MRPLRLSFSKKHGKRPSLYYITPASNWSLDWDAHYITTGINDKFDLRAHTRRSAGELSGQIVHYASLWEGVASLGSKENKRNQVVTTIFHGERDDQKFRSGIDQLIKHHAEFAKIHTSSKIMEKRLMLWGLPREKLVRIPLGVDLKFFRPASSEERRLRRKQFGIPDTAICIGSFQKDGKGWNDGNEPKMIKGPDIFLGAIELLCKNYPLFILLSAPARGYVKRGLKNLGVPFLHVVEKDYLRVARLYHALDIYMVASREEGGPKGSLEALSAGVPLVSTQVGLVPELVRNGKNGLLAKSEDISQLANSVRILIEQPDLRSKLSRRGLETIQVYDWSRIAARYYHEIYAPLIKELDNS